ncbi:MAG: 50S ribosomal protein L6 [Candidatus Gracilibacteria bacterium]
MSRIGRKLVEIPNGVTVTKDAEGALTVKGPKGTLKLIPHELINVEISEKEITVTRKNNEKLAKSLHGLTRSKLNNMIKGVSEGFQKTLEIIGVGFRIQLQGKKLILNLGYSHPIEFPLPEGITIEMEPEKKNVFTVKGFDKELVGHTSAIIRGFKKPEPYKGKGIKYIDEHIRRKAGKTAASAGAGASAA